METLSGLNMLKAVQSGLTQAAPTAAQTVMLYNPDGTPAGKYLARQLMQDMANAGSGQGTCSTAATTAAKTASITDFILLKNGFVAIRFQNAVSVPDATLNISSTGAKTIKINGANLQPGVIKAGMTAIMVYDGTAYNIVGLMGLEGGGSPSDLYVDMGLPSGLLWAKRNIDITQANGFAASEYQYDCSFFSWGNTDGHNPITETTFDYNWGGVNENEPYYEGQPYGSTPGSKLTGNIAPSADCARANLGAPWRLPTNDEFGELFTNSDFIDANGAVIAAATENKLITMNSIVGIRIKSKINSNILFFPCSGVGAGTSRSNRGSYGYYGSATFNSARNARYLLFYSGGVNPQLSNFRYRGFAVRPVQ